MDCNDTSVFFEHKSVLLKEAVESLNIKPNGIYVDGTSGGAGHSFQIASRLNENGKLIAMDQDADAIVTIKKRLACFDNRIIVCHDNFCNLKQTLEYLQIPFFDGLLLDLGVSSYQLDTPERGFSYQNDAPLDMRMDKNQPFSAWDVVNTYSEEQIKKILWKYGEEKYAGNIAKKIVMEREKKSINTTQELVDIIKSAMPSFAKEGAHHPAKRSFQAIRIEVNHELDVIEPTIRDAVTMLNDGGRIAIITFHSLEDRIVKTTFADLAQGCICPKSLPVCICGHKPSVSLITKKSILPSEEELADNPRARSAKLRVVEKIGRKLLYYGERIPTNE